MTDLANLGGAFATFVSEGSSDVVVPEVRFSGTDRLLEDVSALLQRDLSELIVARRVSFGRLHQVYYPRSSGEIPDCMASDTLILQGLELAGGELRRVCEHISGQLAKKVAATSYLSSPLVETFDWHSDMWDSLIVQLAGMKRFHFRHHQSVLLEAGNTLMFRKGVEHRAETLEHSIHISISARD